MKQKIPVPHFGSRLRKLRPLIFKTALVCLLAVFAESCTYNDLNREIAPTRIKTAEGAIEDKLSAKFSLLLNDALQYKEVRQFLKDEVVKKIDGDFDILYAAVRNKPIVTRGVDGSTQTTTFENILLKGIGKSTGRTSAENLFVDSIFNYFPVIQIAFPETSKNSPLTWNVSETVPYVTIVESDHDEATTKKLPAITPAGNHIEIDANVIPNEFFAVVGKSERIVAVKTADLSAHNKTARAVAGCLVFEGDGYSYYTLSQGCGGGGGGGTTGGGSTQPTCREYGVNEFLTQINVPDISSIESWVKGAPELKLQIKTANASGSQIDIFATGQLDAPSRDGIANSNWWDLTDIDMFQWSQPYTTGAVVYLWTEIDGGDLVTVTIAYSPPNSGLTVTLNFKIGDGDDQCGWRTLQLTECGNQFSTGTINWRSRYFRY